MSSAVVVAELEKKCYGAVSAVRGVSFTVEKSEVFAILGRKEPARPRRWRSSKDSARATLSHQIRHEQLSFWRNPQSAFFTFVFPVVIIVIFGALFGHGDGSSYFYG